MFNVSETGFSFRLQVKWGKRAENVSADPGLRLPQNQGAQVSLPSSPISTLRQKQNPVSETL
jgi:hypothetical protein